MPEITPILPHGTMEIHRSTQTPSARLSQQMQQEAPTQTTPEPKSTKDSSEPAKEEVSRDQTRFNKLLEREKQIVNYRKKLEHQQKQLDIEKAQNRQWQEAAELAKGNKLEALAKLGITYDDLTQQILNNGQIPPAQIAESKAKEIAQREIDAYKKQQEELATQNQTKQYEAAISQLTSEIKYAVDKAADKYPLVKLDESYQDIAKWIETEFHRTGRVTPVEEALERWENDALSGLEELAKIDKVRSKFTSKEPPQPAPTQRPTQNVTQTLSQKATAPIPSPKSMTDAERRQRAIDVFYGRQT